MGKISNERLRKLTALDIRWVGCQIETMKSEQPAHDARLELFKLCDNAIVMAREILDLRVERDELLTGIVEAAGQRDDALTRLAAMRVRASELKAALRPFADAWHRAMQNPKSLSGGAFRRWVDECQAIDDNAWWATADATVAPAKPGTVVQQAALTLAAASDCYDEALDIDTWLSDGGCNFHGDAIFELIRASHAYASDAQDWFDDALAAYRAAKEGDDE